MNLEEKRMKRKLGEKCSVCDGNPDCPINKGVGTDIHEVFVTRGMLPKSRLSDIRKEWNCAPVCNQVNTGAQSVPEWKRIVRMRKLALLGDGDIRRGVEIAQAHVDALKMKVKYIVAAEGDL